MDAAVVGKFVSVSGADSRYPEDRRWSPSPLDRALTALKQAGERVLGFRRDGRHWLIKVMA